MVSIGQGEEQGGEERRKNTLKLGQKQGSEKQMMSDYMSKHLLWNRQ